MVEPAVALTLRVAGLQCKGNAAAAMQSDNAPRTRAFEHFAVVQAEGCVGYCRCTLLLELPQRNVKNASSSSAHVGKMPAAIASV
jgi:hypothetical protein